MGTNIPFTVVNQKNVWGSLQLGNWDPQNFLSVALRVWGCLTEISIVRYISHTSLQTGHFYQTRYGQILLCMGNIKWKML